MEQYTQSPLRIGRRGFLQVIAAAGAAGALYHFGLGSKNIFSHTVRQSRTMMGTQINLIVHGPDLDACEDAVAATFSRMDKLVKDLSRHDQHSELSTLNSRGFLPQPSSDLQQVLRLGHHLSSITEGAFDVSVLPLLQLYTDASPENLPPADLVEKTLQLVDYRKIRINDSSIELLQRGMGITLDGIGKGYIVDQGVTELRSRNFPNVYVEAGGDLMVTAAKPGNRPWRIGISNPRPHKANKLIAIDISNSAVATSGDYMQPFSSDLQHHHIINPRTGISPPELASATISAPTVAMADGLATAAMVMGPEQAIATLESLPDCEGFFIGKDLREFRTQGFPA